MDINEILFYRIRKNLLEIILNFQLKLVILFLNLYRRNHSIILYLIISVIISLYVIILLIFLIEK